MDLPAVHSTPATVVDLFFHNMDRESRCVPYIANEEGVEYVCPSCVVGAEGTIAFDGYFYIDDGPLTPEEELLPYWKRPTRYGRHLPIELRMVMQRREKEPSRREVDDEKGWTRNHYNVLETHDCIIEVYKRVTHESTDRVSEIEDDDGEPMSVCFFPTNRQTLYFRVLELPKQN